MNASDLTRPRVLCIDDSLLVRKTIAMTLGSRVDFLSAESAEKGLQLAAEQQPVLIITDINMPGMNGYEMLAALKANPATAGIPVVALTANSSPSEKERGRAAGFADYVTKSADLSAIMRLVAHHLQPDAA